MKVLLSFTITISALLILLPGCSKDSNSTAGQYYMRAAIGADTFDAEGLSQAYLTTSYSAGITSNIIAGKASDGKLIQITLLTTSGNSVAVGTVPLNTGIANAYYYPQGTNSSYISAVSGTLIITQILPNIVGTFGFLCTDSTNITNGSFSVRVP